MSREKRILLVSRDVRVLQARKLMLGTYFDVYPAARVAEASRFLSEHSFHLIILCYSLSDEDCAEILEAAQRRRTPIPVLMITFHGFASARVAGAVQISMDEGPLALLKRSAEMLGFDFKTNGKLINALQQRRNTELPVDRCA